MVVFKETVEDCTILGTMKMVYYFPVMYYLWNDREHAYNYTYFEDLPDQFKVNTISLKYSLKTISVYVEEV